MSEQLSTGLVNYLTGTGSLKAFLETCELRIYAAPAPASADAAATTTLLCVIKSNAGDTFLNVDGPVVGALTQKAGEVWSGTNLATDTAGYFRFCLSADDDLVTTTYKRAQGEISTSGKELNLDNTLLTIGNTTVISNYVFRQIQE